MKVRNIYIGTIFLKEYENDLGDFVENKGSFCRKSILYKLGDNSNKVKDIIFGGTYKIGIGNVKIGANYANRFDSNIVLQILKEEGYEKKHISKRKFLKYVFDYAKRKKESEK